jgi:hypothetical protein
MLIAWKKFAHTEGIKNIRIVNNFFKTHPDRNDCVLKLTEGVNHTFHRGQVEKEWEDGQFSLPKRTKR